MHPRDIHKYIAAARLITGEEIRPLKMTGYRYLISESGRIFSLFSAAGPRATLYEVRTQINHGGYVVVSLNIRNRRRLKKLVHRLVASAFLGLDISDLDIQVNHLDGHKTNNHASNLALCSRAENIAHASSMGLLRRDIGFSETDCSELDKIFA